SGEKHFWHDQLFTLINPRLTAKTGTITFEEGCFSFPGMFGEVERARTISVVAQDVDGKEFTLAADGLFSICVQHEIDHLNGVVFVNHMEATHAASIKNKMLEPKV
ncbi:MAG: peptide deformylase, partial [Pseudomonadota bacterium]|nr:peptide deformylase [Pseudomonadota bacterium]